MCVCVCVSRPRGAAVNRQAGCTVACEAAVVLIWLFIRTPLCWCSPPRCSQQWTIFCHTWTQQIRLFFADDFILDTCSLSVNLRQGSNLGQSARLTAAVLYCKWGEEDWFQMALLLYWYSRVVLTFSWTQRGQKKQPSLFRECPELRRWLQRKWLCACVNISLGCSGGKHFDTMQAEWHGEWIGDIDCGIENDLAALGRQDLLSSLL